MNKQSDSNRRNQFLAEPPGRAQRPLISTWNAIIIAAGLMLVAAVVFASRGENAGSFAGAGDPAADLSFPLGDFADGQARFFKYVSSTGKEIRFFIMRSRDGVTRAAFDTCDVCFKERRGYRQSGDTMICNNCEQTFDSNSINEVRGGCNPAPIDREILGDRIVLRAAALEQGAGYF